MSWDRCRHCLAVVVPDARRCPVCRGLDPTGRRFALLGSLFFGSLAGAVVVSVSAAVLWDDWPRWVEAFGQPEDPRAVAAASTSAFVAAVAAFVVALLPVSSVTHRWFRTPRP